MQSPACRLSMSAAAALYSSGMSASAITQHQSVTPNTHAKRDAIHQEFDSFLSQLPAAMGRSIKHCSPADVMVFMETQWVPSHLGSQTKSGHRLAAPSSVEGALCNLSTLFQQHGRGQVWDENTQSGNPIWSLDVKQWKRGYTRIAANQGYVTTGAQELTSGKMQSLLGYLHGCMAEPDPIKRHAIARDGLAFSILWQTGGRGANAGPLTAHDFVTLDGNPAFPFIHPTCQLAAGTIIQVTPQRLKTCLGRNKEPMFIHTLPRDQAAMCPTHWWQLCLQTAQACGYQVSQSDFIARTLGRGNRSVKSDPISTDALCLHLKGHLRHLGLSEGESMHSFRRGRSIEDQAAGLPTSAIMDKLLIRSKSVFKRSYQAAGFHDSSVKRLRASSQPQARSSMPSASASTALAACPGMPLALAGCQPAPMQLQPPRAAVSSSMTRNVTHLAGSG